MTKLSTNPSLLIPTLEIELNTFLVTQFWTSIEKGVLTDDCWNWTAHKNKDGYGLIWDGKSGRHYRSNRLSWTLHNGLIPSGLVVCHTCDHPGCVNPLHLFLGDLLDNNADAIAKGRLFCTRHDVKKVPIHEARSLIAEVMKKERSARVARGLTGPKPGTKNAPKLNETQVREIFAALNNGEKQSVIAKRYGVAVNNVWRMAKGIGWAHIGREFGFTVVEA